MSADANSNKTAPFVYMGIAAVLPFAYLIYVMAQPATIDASLWLVILPWIALTLTPLLWQLAFRSLQARMLNTFGLALTGLGIVAAFVLGPLYLPSAFALLLAANSLEKSGEPGAAVDRDGRVRRTLAIVGAALAIAQTVFLAFAESTTRSALTQTLLLGLLCIAYLALAFVLASFHERVDLITMSLLALTFVLSLAVIPSTKPVVSSLSLLIVWLVFVSAAGLPRPRQQHKPA